MSTHGDRVVGFWFSLKRQGCEQFSHLYGICAGDGPVGASQSSICPGPHREIAWPKGSRKTHLHGEGSKQQGARELPGISLWLSSSSELEEPDLELRCFECKDKAQMFLIHSQGALSQADCSIRSLIK